jgi:hypothetical protein
VVGRNLQPSEKPIVLGFLPLIVITLLFGIYLNTTIFSPTSPSIKIRFELQEFSLCTSNCVYPSPYLSGTLLFISNSSTSQQPTSLQYFVNGIPSGIEQITPPANVPKGQNWAILWKSGANNVNVISGNTYLITFKITYEDGIAQNDSVTLTAS